MSGSLPITGPAQRGPELTLRAILTGIVLGALLTPCNIYSGLKIGWSFNMSIAAGLLGAGFWGLTRAGVRGRPWGMLENNINQTTASSAASIISGGLVAPIPALTMLTGQVLPWHFLALWVFAVSILGVIVAAGLRQQMLERENLRFPAGVATAETMKRIHEHGREAAAKLRLLLSAGGLAAALKVFNDLVMTIPRLAPPLTLPKGISASNLGLSLDPSLLMVGFGAIIGLRAGVSLLLGALIAWAGVAPYVLGRGWAERGAMDEAWFGPLVTWLLWPGATLLVVSVLASLAIYIGGAMTRRRQRSTRPRGRAPLHLAVATAVVTLLIGAAAHGLFGIRWFEAVLGVALSLPLAFVALRVVGETGIPPIGALGKITQLTFAVASPGNVTSNLMSANITGGTAGQAADLMNDLKTGQIIGATARLQIVAQVFGVLTGSLVGSLIYLVLVPDPAAMLLTESWPAPAVATWKAVAEVLASGISAIPPGALPAMGIAAVLGILMAILEHVLPPRFAWLLPSAPAVGLAFVIPAWNAISMFAGALLAYLLRQATPPWAEKYTITLATGLVAGESLAGVALAFRLLVS